MSYWTRSRKRKQAILSDTVLWDLTQGILSHLPAKSLLRFRCVSKPWCSLIDDSRFIKLHANQSIESNFDVSLIFQQDKTLYSSDLNLDNLEVLDYPLKSARKNVILVGSCNGWLCLSYSSDAVIVLWNLSTRKYRILPAMLYPYRGRDMSRLYGFGYDSTNDDYKLVRIMSFGIPPMFVFQVGVYSLKTNTWRTIPSPLLYRCNVGEQKMAIHSNNALHWLTHKGMELTAFNLATEQCQKVPLPDKIGPVLLGALKGRLCLVKTYQTVCLDVWEMKAYGVKDSWTKLFSVSLEGVVSSFACATPICWSRNGNRILFKHSSDSTLYWYDLNNKRVKQISLPGLQRYSEVIVYSRSLVPPAVPENLMEIRNSGKKRKKRC